MKYRPLSEFNPKEHGDVVWLKLKAHSVPILGCFYDCQWMRDDPEYDDAEDAFTLWPDDDVTSDHIELDTIAGWRPATADEIHSVEESERQ